MTIPSHFQLALDPVAEPAAVVRVPHMRFTFLTSQLIRIEYSPSDQFEDRATMLFRYRRQPVPAFHVEQSDDSLTITTDHLRLDYAITELGPTRDTLSVEVLATHSTWRFGDSGERENLRGTMRTLDGVEGATRLERGLMARNGWAVVDDSRTLVLDAKGWIKPRENQDAVDTYLFGYGHDYKGCLREFIRLTGQTPMIPRWMLGNWWSRYWEYTQQELFDLMTEFRQREVPLSVCIIDMDWHITCTGNNCSGWTGYTWNRELFPDPEGLLRTLHEQGLHVALNLHPAEGVHPHEAQYADMARAMDIAPESDKPVEFDLTDPKFAQAYFKILHHPYESQGVDFWWLDWQQGTLSKIPGLDPLTWLNHLHFHDLGRDGTRRPIIFSRWGGIGGHRYPIGFSGDAIVSWASLQFQPYLTATAANVAFGWWSHDIGGHMRGIEDPELYTRWVQYGVFSPILRLHSTKNPYHERRPWGHGEEVFKIVRDAMQLRHSLIPYLYSMAFRNYQQDLPLITPMYYDYPEETDAYRCRNQYQFGSELIAAPFTTPRDPDTRLSRQTVWLPAGDWFDFFSGEYLAGNRWHTFYGGLDKIPVIARAGAIVPVGPRAGWDNVGNPAELTLEIFPGASNRFMLQEDDGQTTAYERGHYALTPFQTEWTEDRLALTIGPVDGDANVIPSRRTYHLRVHGIRRPDRIRLTMNDREAVVSSEYDERTETLMVKDIAIPSDTQCTLAVSCSEGPLMSRRDRRAERIRDLLRAFRMDTEIKRQIDSDIEQIMHDPSRLSSWSDGVKDAHLAALTSIIQSRM